MRKSSRHPVFSFLLLLTAVLYFGMSLTPAVADVPPLTSRVNDYAAMLSKDTIRSLEDQLENFERSDSTQIAILTIDSLQGDSIEDFSIRVAEAWKLGRKEHDNGALLIISKNDRKIRIEVGYGLEGRLTDLLAGRIIDNIISPAFKQGQFDQGVQDGVQAMISATQGEYVGDGTAASGTAVSGSQTSSGDIGLSFKDVMVFLTIIIGFFTCKKLLGLHVTITAIVGVFIVPILGIIFTGNGGTGFIVLLAIAGFLLGALVGFLSPAQKGFFSGGGGDGSGSSSSSGGGFSGGGGGFGGGGSSGDW